MDMNSSIEKAMILAAGEGTRLRPLTDDAPKSLLPVGNTPIVMHQLRWLKSYGIRKVAINLYHEGGRIIAQLGDGKTLGMDIRYSPEEVLLGTAGGVKRMEAFFDKTFYVVYVDTISNVNLSSLAEFHMQKQALMTIVLFETANARETGIVEWGHSNGIVFVHGKLTVGEAMSPPVIRNVKEYANNADTVIIDVPPGTSCPVITSVCGSDFCILVTEPTPFGLNDLTLTVEVLRKMNIPLGVIINRSDLGDDKTDRYCQKFFY